MRGSKSSSQNKLDSEKNQSSKEESMSILLHANPRPGGYIKHIVSPNNQDNYHHSYNEEERSFSESSCKCTSFHNQKSQERNIHEIVPEDLNDLDLSSIRGYETDSDAKCGTIEYKYNQINLTGTIVSTIMLMTSGKEVPKAQLEATVEYLDAVKDDNNNIPPNIRGFLKYIEMKFGVVPNSRLSKR